MIFHRRFEVKHGVTIPESKKQLEFRLRNKQAFEFHKLFYDYGHQIPYLEEWLNRRENPEEPKVVLVIPYENVDWEPQFVADSRIPFHDEMFPYRFRDHTQLVICVFQSCIIEINFRLSISVS